MNRRSRTPHRNTRWTGHLLFWTVVVVGQATLVAADVENRPGKNIALGKHYRLSPPPTYRHCTDPGDKTQLTDGKTTTDYFWTQQGTVGWQAVQFATVTIDLEKKQPISGAAFTTAGGADQLSWQAPQDRTLADTVRTQILDALVALQSK